MIVSNRKLFKKRPARDNLNEIAGIMSNSVSDRDVSIINEIMKERMGRINRPPTSANSVSNYDIEVMKEIMGRINRPAGIMASSPELLNEVQKFTNGGDVQLPGSVGSIVQLLNTIRDKFTSKTPVNPIQEIPVRLPDGTMGFAIYENGELKGYTSKPSSSSMMKIDRGPNVQKINKRILVDPKFAYDRGVAERIGAMDKSTPLREDAAGLAEGIAGLLKTPITTIKDMTSDLSNYFFGPSVSAKKDIDDKDTPYPKGVDIGTIADDVGPIPGVSPGQITKIIDPEGFRQQEEDLPSSLGSDFYSDPEEIQKMIDAIRIGETEQALKEKRIREGEEATERMKGPVPPTTDLGTRLERVKAERDAIEAKEQQDDLRARLAGQTKDVKGFTDPTSLEEVLNRRQITNEMGGIDPRVDMPPGAFPKGTKQPSLEQPKPSEIDEKDTETFDAMGDIADPNQKQNFGTVNQVVQQTTGTDIKSLMEEFTSQAPEYEGMNKGMAIAKIGFAMAAGQSPNALTNIANALSMGADMFLKDDKEKQAFNRQIRLSALQYGLGEISKERSENRLIAREDRKLNYFVASKDMVHPETGQKIEKDGLVSLTTGYINKNGLPSNVTTTELAKAAIDTKIAIDKIIEKRKKDKILDVDKAVILQEKVNQAVVDFTSANTLKEIVEGNAIRNAEGNITGIQPAFMDLVNKVAVAASIELDPDKYENVAKYNSGMRRVSNLLLKDLLGEGSKNVSNIDRQLADEIVGLYNTYITTDPDILNDKLQNILTTLQQKEKTAVSILNTSLEGVVGKTTASGEPVDLGVPQEIISRIQGEKVVPSTTWGMKDGIYRKLK